MGAQAYIDELDSGLAEAGETVSLVRLLTGGTTFSIAGCPAAIRGYNPSDLVAGSGIGQQDQQVIMSPTRLRAGGWPGTASRPPGDPMVPRQGDRVISNRGVLTIQAASGVYVESTLVRIVMQARGT